MVNHVVRWDAHWLILRHPVTDVTVNDLSADDLKAAANYILGCADTDTNTVNGNCEIGDDANPPRVCLADGDACGDCLYVFFFVGDTYSLQFLLSN